MMQAEERTPLLGRKKERRRSQRRSRSRDRGQQSSASSQQMPNDGRRESMESGGGGLDNNNDYLSDPPFLDRVGLDPFGGGTTTTTTTTAQSSRRRPRQPTTAAERQRDGYSGGLGNFESLSPDNVPPPTPPRKSATAATQQKHDRRGLIQRIRQFVRQKIQFPTMGYRSLDSDGAATDTAATPSFSWRWTLGTREADGTWLNFTDQAGTAMALLVWVLLGYCAGTMLVLARHGHVPPHVAAVQCTLLFLIWACHAKTMLTDPGTIPCTAVPLVTKGVKFHTMCSVCQSYKPAYTHHCRICNRCISRMDHHCPWMNNCIGAANLKHFTLFLVYAWIGSASALGIFAWNYFFCGNQNCEFHGLEIQLVRAMSLICLGTVLFTSSMLMNVIYGIMTGTGTIDRLKQKADSTWHMSDQEATPLTHIWGTGSIWGWWLPIDPVWDDFGKIMGYGTTRRLLPADTDAV